MTREELELLTDIRDITTQKAREKLAGQKRGKGRESEPRIPPPLLAKSLVKAMFITFSATHIDCLPSAGDQHSTYCSQRDQAISVNVIFENSMLSFLYYYISITVQFLWFRMMLGYIRRIRGHFSRLSLKRSFVPIRYTQNNYLMILKRKTVNCTEQFSSKNNRIAGFHTVRAWH